MTRLACRGLLPYIVATSVVVGVLLSPRDVRAADRLSLAGRWNAGPLTERWNIGDWGPACGPKPTARELPGGAVTIKEEGAELVVAGGGRTFRTSECWEQYPGVSRGSHSVSERSWRTRCNSAPSDPRQTTVVTSVTATDTTMALDEIGEYQFRIEGQNCTASVRRSRSFTVAARDGDAPSAASAASAPEPTAPASARPSASTDVGPGAPSAKAPTNRCAVVGEPIRLDVRPARKVLRPGERFSFRTLGIDANGCAADMRGNWSVQSGGSDVTIAGAMIDVANDAKDGTVELTVGLAGRTARAIVEIATPARYDALLAIAAADGGGVDDSETAVVTSGNLGTSTAVAQDDARTRKTAFVAIIGTLALALASLGLYLLRRHPSQPARGGAGGPYDGTLSAAAGAMAAGGRTSPPRSVTCPSCGTEFPAGSTFCPHDGNRLGPPPLVSFQGPSTAVTGGICPTCGRGYDPGVQTCPVHGDDLVPAATYRAAAHRAPQAPQQRGKICPSCGGRYGAPAVFCGKDGTALVLVN